MSGSLNTKLFRSQQSSWFEYYITTLATNLRTCLILKSAIVMIQKGIF